MDKQDWYEMGAQIGDLVQSAIDSQDFKQLNQSITKAINETLDMVQRNVQDGMRQSSANGHGAGSWRSAYERAAGNGRAAGEEWKRNPHAPGHGEPHAKDYRNVSQTDMGYGRIRYGSDARETKIQKTSSKALKSYKGVTYMAVGYTFTGIFGAMTLIFGVLSRAIIPLAIPAVIFLALTGGFLGMGLKGSKFNKYLKRQKQYLQIMGDRDTCTLDELAAGTGKSKKYVAKDLREMIQKNMFPQGAYLDAMETCLMTSQTAYRQYQDVMKQYEQRKAMEDQARREQEAGQSAAGYEQASASGSTAKKDAADGKNAQGAAGRNEAGLSREIQEILREGREFITHIHECNDDIPGEEISDKLDRLEAVVTKIFDQVARKPESAPDLHKMMSYYLPITRKLVDAYRDLDAQQVEGQNIARTKKEIEDSLDTINTAFENLLDSFFQDTAWDISSDITVLHTMMAQDGLMKKDFPEREA